MFLEAHKMESHIEEFPQFFQAVLSLRRTVSENCKEDPYLNIFVLQSIELDEKTWLSQLTHYSPHTIKLEIRAMTCWPTD